MIQVLYCFAFAVLLLANAGQVDAPFLYWANWVGAVWFVFVGAVAGWQSANK